MSYFLLTFRAVLHLRDRLLLQTEIVRRCLLQHPNHVEQQQLRRGIITVIPHDRAYDRPVTLLHATAVVGIPRLRPREGDLSITETTRARDS